MTTMNTHPSAQTRQHAQQQHSNYAAMWGLIVAAIVAAVAYGYYATERAASAPQRISAAQGNMTVSPAADGTASSMVGQPSGDGLTPSTTAPGTPDTTTTESSAVPTPGYALTR